MMMLDSIPPHRLHSTVFIHIYLSLRIYSSIYPRAIHRAPNCQRHPRPFPPSPSPFSSSRPGLSLPLLSPRPLSLSSPGLPTQQQPPSTSTMTTSWDQQRFSFSPRARGCYLVTDEVVRNLPSLKDYTIGTVHLFLQHTSAAISLNENCDPDVRTDMTTALNNIVPDDDGEVFIHADEGPDDMSGHAKSSLVGVSLTIPISNGRLALGTWQGIYLMEFRNYRHTRHCLATIQGLKK